MCEAVLRRDLTAAARPLEERMGEQVGAAGSVSFTAQPLRIAERASATRLL
jgi:hypothetical protein